ncbi:S41 family peptidase [Robertkochia flava]|uniref:S41 family peptidase n=1 Tax=Robertkochia flava TaxID=3447986 RepID=UPI001CCF3CB0|nr:S41 family peptidase [Robertkochia marina]
MKHIKNHPGTVHSPVPVHQKALFRLTLFALLLCLGKTAYSQGFQGYYRFPTLHENTIIFSAEGDLWKVSDQGGQAIRLTTHHESEAYPVISPDGTQLVFTASYEGPEELYMMPLSGGVPVRLTYENEGAVPTSWINNEEVLYHTTAYATLPDLQVVKHNTKTHTESLIPLAQASEADIDTQTNTVYFVSPRDHRNVTKRYKGGTARQIWKFTEGAEEAVKLTNDHPGESFNPMYHNGRVYFITDRDGIMNIWSMNTEGGDMIQHTQHKTYDIRTADLYDNRIVYHHGADIRILDLNTGNSKKLDIWLPSDLDQLREKWVTNPTDYLTSVNTDPEGEHIVLTARGRLFVAPVKTGRFVNFAPKEGVRYRDAFFSANGKSVYALSDESGEFEFVRIDPQGIKDKKQVSANGSVLRFGGVNSPDGKYIAFHDLENNMNLLDVNTGKVKVISTNNEGIGDYSWSPDSRWISFVQSAENTMLQIMLYNLDKGTTTAVTTDRANSFSPQWSPDGKFLYLISDRNFQSLVGAPWGPRQPEPYFDAAEKLYLIPLQAGTRSPFRPKDELFTQEVPPAEDDKKGKPSKKETEASAVTVTIDLEGIRERLTEIPVKPGNYRNLRVNDNTLFFTTAETGVDAKTHLVSVKISDEKTEMQTVMDDINRFELSGNGKKIIVQKKQNFYAIPASHGKALDLEEKGIDLSGWKFPVSPREDWKQIFNDAWRMERDYFYDPGMHGVNWKAMYDRYYPLLDRITTREELSDLIGRYVGELAALHTSVRGGDTREDKNDIDVASLGARFKRDDASGGYRIEHIYQADPDYPDERSPLDDPYLQIEEGDIITAINGTPVLSVTHIGALLRNQGGKQTRITFKTAKGEVNKILTPIGNDMDLKYRDWEYSRRKIVEATTDEQVGYVHLRAMGPNDLHQWYREFYPVFNRPGLIIDVRHNRGGNIESFILEKLLRKAWMYWKSRSGKPYWNMQYAFRGHIVILVDELTASDGEAFAEGFKRLGLGTSIGTRTWGGEIWLSSVNRLSDNGIARAPMNGVYGEEGEWLIEGHGFVPDIEVVNMPHATFKGEDAQLQAAIDLLLKKISEDPREVPEVPAFPDKSFRNN